MSFSAYFVVYFNLNKPHVSSDYKIVSDKNVAPKKNTSHVIVEEAFGTSYDDARNHLIQKMATSQLSKYSDFSDD